MTETTDFVEDLLYTSILHEIIPPRKLAYDAGVQAHRDGKAFHECPYYSGTIIGLADTNFHSVDALSWRIGWNAQALATNY